MDPLHVLILLGAGLLGGFIAGLVGVGGGIIFAPVLFFYFQATGVAPELVTPLTLGSSLFCTLVASIVSAWFHYRKGAVRLRLAAIVGAFSAAAVFVVTQLVTTQVWYDREAFQLAFGTILLLAVVRMIAGPSARNQDPSSEAPHAGESRRFKWPGYATLGAVTGSVATMAGVGGGVIMVPAFNQLLRIPIQQAVATSSMTIVYISLAGVLTYMLAGWGEPVPATAVGYVDAGRALFLALPTLLTAQLGVRAAHRLNTVYLQRSFAALAFIVAVRLIFNAVTG